MRKIAVRHGDDGCVAWLLVGAGVGGRVTASRSARTSGICSAGGRRACTSGSPRWWRWCSCSTGEFADLAVFMLAALMVGGFVMAPERHRGRRSATSGRRSRAEPAMVIRSYRRVFEVDRRIYRVDRWALPVPGGVPLRAVGYFAATLLAVIAAGALPGIGELVGVLSAPLRFVVLPLAVAVLGTQAAPDGRAAHRFAWDWLRLAAARAAALGGPRRCRSRASRCAGTASSRCAGTPTAPQLHRGRVRGPARVTFNVPVELRRPRPAVGRASRGTGAAARGAVRRDGVGGAAVSRFPLRYAHQNILVGEGDARAALFRVDTVSYPFLAAADKREWLRRLARFAFAVEADFSLWRVCRAYPAERYAEQAMALLDERRQSAAAWRSYLNGHEAHLRELRSFVPEVYLAVSLARSGRRAGARRSIGSRRRVEGLFGVARRGADPGGGDRGAGRRRGARVPARRGVPAGAARDDARAAVAAAPRGVPRRRRAGAG